MCVCVWVAGNNESWVRTGGKIVSISRGGGGGIRARTGSSIKIDVARSSTVNVNFLYLRTISGEGGPIIYLNAVRSIDAVFYPLAGDMYMASRV